ncbi:MAG: helix-turn-helix domain-containing protein [bacterium]|nr:helix-turn-helix domain-containing protein [bacterium]
MELINNNAPVEGFTPAQVHALTGVPPNTLSRWEREFRDYLQAARTEGGHKRYAPEVIQRIEMLKEMILDHGLSLQGAKRHLEVPPREATSQGEIQSAVKSVASEWAQGRTELLDKLAERMANHMLKQLAQDTLPSTPAG